MSEKEYAWILTTDRCVCCHKDPAAASNVCFYWEFGFKGCDACWRELSRKYDGPLTRTEYEMCPGGYLAPKAHRQALIDASAADLQSRRKRKNTRSTPSQKLLRRELSKEDVEQRVLESDSEYSSLKRARGAVFNPLTLKVSRLALLIET